MSKNTPSLPSLSRKPWTRILALLTAILPLPALAAEPLAIASTTTLLTGLITLAEQQDLFTKSGVQVEVNSMPSGDAAIKSLINGQADLCIVSAAPFIKHEFDHPELRLIANIGQWDNEMKIAARQDHGINSPADLRGKRVGIQRGVAFHLFLNRMLMKHGMSEADIDPVYMPAERLPEALASGEIDAMSNSDPYLSKAEELLGDKLTLISMPGIYVNGFNLVTTTAFLESPRSRKLVPLLSALHEAEKMARQDPDGTSALLAAELNQPQEKLRQQLLEMQLRLSMDDQLIRSLESLAQWRQMNQYGTAPKRINFLPYLHPGPLLGVNPQAVTLRP
jgi:ABC-type nitrate/sulfonate/bicarbonate transport system substrate-binding protein